MAELIIDIEELDASVKALESIVEKLSKEIKEKKSQLKVAREKQRSKDFYDKYQEHEKFVVTEYEKKVCSYIKQDTYGYRVWVRYPHHIHHAKITEKDYEVCLPTQKEKDAYFAYYGMEIEVPSSPHRTRWGS